MGSHRIAVMPGDGIGKETIREAMKVLRAAERNAKGAFKLETTELDWNSDYFVKHGRMMPEDGIQVLRGYDAILFGAVGDARVPEHVSVAQTILAMRRGLDQWANIRPARLLAGAPCPLKDKQPGQIDFVVVRENTEGEYADVGGNLFAGTPNEVAVQSAVFTRRGTERILRYGFELCRKRKKQGVGRGKLTSVSKQNAQRHSQVFWHKVFEEVRKDYPDIESGFLYIDAACMDLVRKPEAFDVIVSSNLFGDILTDVAGVVVGGLGIAPSANLNPDKAAPSMFEPVHGSAPDIAGKNLANPLAAVMAGAMMLDFLGEDAAARTMSKAVESVLADPKAPKTKDFGGNASTSEVGDEIAARLG
ncbi:MAG: 3-isopropylmalate dehydrogenase [Planctomycetota bacterium]|nr:3-isopropylmalate dehydrogenase [Planctomycetota bacterium]